MHFSKIVATTFFAVLATATPVPSEISVSAGQFEQVAKSLDSFAQDTQSSASEISTQLGELAENGGSASDSIQSAKARFNEKVEDLLAFVLKTSESLKNLESSYQETDSNAANHFGKL